MQTVNLKKTFLYTLIASVAVSAVLGIGVILFGEFGEFETKVLATTFTITCTSILGLACGAYYESSGSRPLPAAGIFFSIISAALVIFLIWENDAFYKDAWKAALTTTILATACGHLCLISLATLERKYRWSRYAIYIAVALLTAILLWLLWWEPEGESEIVSRTIGVLSIAIAALTVITPVLHKLSRREPTISDIDAEIEQLRSRISELEAQKVAAAGEATDADDARDLFGSDSRPDL